MRSLGAVLGLPQAIPQVRPQAITRRKYRKNAVFLRDMASVSTKLDRNQRARLLHQAEAIERNSKARGQRSGILGLTGLQVLRVLILKFQHTKTGHCFPSYLEIQRMTGFCKQTVCSAVRRLEAVGILRVVRRLVRREVEREGVTFVTTVQGSNVYAFTLDGKIAIAPLLATTPRSFPKPNALIKLLFHPSRRGRREVPNTRFT